MAKDFIREGATVAFPQTGYDGWWTVMVTDDQERALHIYTGSSWDTPDTAHVDNLIKVLKAIKKEASK